MRHMRLPSPPLNGQFGFPLGAAVAVAVTTITVAAGATTDPWLALIALTAVSVTTAAITTLWASAATAAVCWALYAGFVIGRHGSLAFNHQSALAGAIVAAAELVTFAAVTTARWSRDTQNEHRGLPNHATPVT